MTKICEGNEKSSRESCSFPLSHLSPLRLTWTFQALPSPLRCFQSCNGRICRNFRLARFAILRIVFNSRQLQRVNRRPFSRSQSVRVGIGRAAFFQPGKPRCHCRPSLNFRCHITWLGKNQRATFNLIAVAFTDRQHGQFRPRIAANLPDAPAVNAGGFTWAGFGVL